MNVYSNLNLVIFNQTIFFPTNKRMLLSLLKFELTEVQIELLLFYRLF